MGIFSLGIFINCFEYIYKVAPLAKLLGFFIGPQAGSKMWEGPMKKYNERILDLKKGQASIVLNSITYNSRIVQ